MSAARASLFPPLYSGEARRGCSGVRHASLVGAPCPLLTSPEYRGGTKLPSRSVAGVRTRDLPSPRCYPVFSMVTAAPPEVLAETERSLQSHGRVVLCQIVRAAGSTPGKMGWKLLARPDGTFFGNLGGGAFEALVKADALAKLRSGGVATSEVKRYYLTEEATQGEPTGMVCGGMAEVFLEVMVAAPVLVICGGG